MDVRGFWRGTLVGIALIVGVAGVAAGQDLASFEKRPTVKVLATGVTVIVCARPEAPQGQRGLAHMCEHMACKGTDEIGTTNYAAEKVALAKVEVAYAAYDAEIRKRVGQDAATLA